MNDKQDFTRGSIPVKMIKFMVPMSWFMSIQPDASLMWIGLAAPTAACFGILLCFIYYIRMNRQSERSVK